MPPTSLEIILDQIRGPGILGPPVQIRGPQVTPPIATGYQAASMLGEPVGILMAHSELDVSELTEHWPDDNSQEGLIVGKAITLDELNALIEAGDADLRILIAMDGETVDALTQIWNGH